MEGPAIHLNSPGGSDLPRPLLQRAIQRTLKAETVERGQFSLTFVDDDSIRELNRRYLDHDGVTDVIAFALHEDDEAPLGDIYVGIDQARRQARDAGIALEEELVRLAIHGTLHVLGYDHPDEEPDRSGSPLYRLQERLVEEALRGSEEGAEDPVGSSDR